MDVWSAFVFGISIGPSVHAVLNYVVPIATRTIDVLAERLCPRRPEAIKHVPSLAETFDDLDAVSAAETLETLRQRPIDQAVRPDRPEWVPDVAEARPAVDLSPVALHEHEE